MMASDEPPVTARLIELSRPGSAAFCAAPGDPARTVGTVVLAMHLWGVDASMRDAAVRFARGGFATLVPNLYAHLEVPSGDGETNAARFVPFARALTAETVEPEIAAAESWLREAYPGLPVAIAGFCMGGVIALRRTFDPARFAVAAVWYGALANLDPSSVAVPIVASFGALDAGIPGEQIAAFRDGLRVPHDVELYAGAGHGFCDAGRDAYHPIAAEASWTRALSFLTSHIGPKRPGLTSTS
jgi:carboxymethylenebutenolidase